MDFKTIKPHHSIALFVKDILVFESGEKNQNTILPFFADGYPGLMYQETENGLFVSPHNKEMPALFLYGQTIQPVELHINGSYKLIVFQLYPFVLNSFFNITAKDLNDSCYDLNLLPIGAKSEKQLLLYPKTNQQIQFLTDFLFEVFHAKKEMLDFTVRQAIQLIIDHKGKIPVTQLSDKLNITARTLERRFSKEVGISPKQFSHIIQFQQSLEQLATKDFTKLTDIVYANGFADQSHFIRVFKAFSGKTPKRFSAKI